jgi:hypothetical protein
MRHKLSALRIAVMALGVTAAAVTGLLHAQAQQRADASPRYRVDAFWPKPLPNKWSMQQIVDIYVDRDDHVCGVNAVYPAPRSSSSIRTATS